MVIIYSILCDILCSCHLRVFNQALKIIPKWLSMELWILSAWDWLVVSHRTSYNEVQVISLVSLPAKWDVSIIYCYVSSCQELMLIRFHPLPELGVLPKALSSCWQIQFLSDVERKLSALRTASLLRGHKWPAAPTQTGEHLYFQSLLSGRAWALFQRVQLTTSGLHRIFPLVIHSVSAD